MKYKNNFFYNKNTLYILIYPLIYVIEYLAVFFSTFITWYIQFTCNDGHKCSIHTYTDNNNILNINHIDILHIITASSVIYHIYNEITRELFLIKQTSKYISSYNSDKYVLSYMLLFILYTLNIVMTHLLLLKYEQYNIITSINIIFHTIVIIPILFKSYSVLVDKNYTASVIFYNNVYYTKYTNIINYSMNLEQFDTNKIYTKDVYI